MKVLEKKGSWSWNKTKKILTAIFPSVKSYEDSEEYVTVTIKFKPVGKDLKVVAISPSSAGNVDAMFVRR